MTTSTAYTPAVGQPHVPTTMRAAVLKRQGDMALETLLVPGLEPDQVLVQVTAVGVCGSDVHYYEHGRIGDKAGKQPGQLKAVVYPGR